MTTLLTAVTDFAPDFRFIHLHANRDSQLMLDVFEFRYQVYCVECRFLDAADYPQRHESDAFDDNSAHFCALNQRDQLVGYVRLVRPDAAQTFPFQQHCGLAAGMSLAEPSLAAEISRLMVRQDYRRRRGDTLVGVTVEPEQDEAVPERRDHSPKILLGLYRQMYSYSLENGIRFWYAAMERSLDRVLTRMNFGFRQLGPQADYYGPVAPYMLDLRELEQRLDQSKPQLMAWMRSA